MDLKSLVKALVKSEVENAITAMLGADPAPAKAPARGKPAKAKKKAPPRAPKAAKDAGPPVDTGTPEARDAYDGAVLDAVIATGNAGSEALRSHVGGTSLQIRKSLARLVAAGVVVQLGKARGTTYAPNAVATTTIVRESEAARSC